MDHGLWSIDTTKQQTDNNNLLFSLSKLLLSINVIVYLVQWFTGIISSLVTTVQSITKQIKQIK